MANFKLNGVTVASESGGTVTLDGGVSFPAGHVIQTKVQQINSQYAVGASSGTTIVANFSSGPAIGTNSKYRVTIMTTGMGWDTTVSSDNCDLGIDIRWSINSNTFTTNRIGVSHPHKFSPSSGGWNDLVNFYGADAGTPNGSLGAWSGQPFSMTQSQILSVNAGTTLYWKCDIWAGQQVVFWNRFAASATNNIGHGQFTIEEIAQ